MKLHVRTVAGAAAVIEAELELPLSVVRAQAASALGLDTEPALVLQGRLLTTVDDSRSVNELGFTDGCLLVAVSAKAKTLPDTSPSVDSAVRAATTCEAASGSSPTDAELARQLQADEDASSARRVQELQDGDIAREEQARQALGDQRAADVASTPSLCFVRGELPNCARSTWIPLMVDTGAQTSILTSGLAERLGLMPQLDRSASGIAGGVGAARVLGRLRSVTVRFGELDLEVDFSVLDGTQMPSANLAILGLDQLAVHHMVVDLDTRVLRVGGVEGYAVRFLERYEVPDDFRLDASQQRCTIQ